MKQINWQQTPFTDLLGIRYPIVQGPFGGGFSSVKLTSTVSNLGGLGSFGAQPYTAAQIVEFCKQIRAETGKPFNVNLWVNDRDERLGTYDADEYEQLKQIFRPYFERFGLSFPEMPKDLGPRFEDQVQAILDARPPVFSFVFGIPDAAILSECKRLGIKTVGNATTPDEAVALELAGVDAIVATGFEAGGHRVSFLRPAEDSLMGTFSLIPQVADTVKIPVVAAGGIADARGMKAAFALGADAVQIGTAFLATQESNASPLHKDKLFSPAAKYTTLTRIFSGRLARGFTSILTNELKQHEIAMAPYPMQSRFLASLREAATRNGQDDYITFWSGQSAPLITHHETTLLFNALVTDMNHL